MTTPTSLRAIQTYRSHPTPTTRISSWFRLLPLATKPHFQPQISKTPMSTRPSRNAAAPLASSKGDGELYCHTCGRVICTCYLSSLRARFHISFDDPMNPISNARIQHSPSPSPQTFCPTQPAREPPPTLTSTITRTTSPQKIPPQKPVHLSQILLRQVSPPQTRRPGPEHRRRLRRFTHCDSSPLTSVAQQCRC